MLAENGPNLDILKHFEMSLDQVDLTDINEAIDSNKCNDPNKLKEVCNVTMKQPPSGPGQNPQAQPNIKLDVCKDIQVQVPQVPTPPGKGTREKREISSGRPAPNGPVFGDFGPGPDEDFEKNAEFLKLFMTLDPQTRYNIGHRIGSRESTLLQKNISSFISGCTYKGGTCDGETFWFPFSTAEFGNCYAFNYDRNMLDTRRERKATLTGTSYGLSVEIFLDQTNYMLNKLSKQAGARIVIHDPANPPLPDEYGMD